MSQHARNDDAHEPDELSDDHREGLLRTLHREDIGRMSRVELLALYERREARWAAAKKGTRP